VHGFRCYDNIVPNEKCQRVLVLTLRLVWDSRIGELMQKELCAFLRELLAEDSMRSDE